MENCHGLDENFIQDLVEARGVDGNDGDLTEHPLWILHKRFLPNVVGKVTYEREKTTKPTSTFVTVSDEAFAILCLENVYKKKIHELYNKDGICCPWVGNVPPPVVTESKYTSKKQPGGASYSTKFSGWSPDAFARYENFYRSIAAARGTKKGRTIESLILVQEQKTMPLKKKMRRAKNIEKEGKQQ